MAGSLGRVLVGGKDCGAGFALGPRLVVTAHHVVRSRNGQPVLYIPVGGEGVGVTRIQPDVQHDAAILWLASDSSSCPRLRRCGERGGGWSRRRRVEMIRRCTEVTTARMIIQKNDQPVEVLQLEVGEQLGDFGGYSGSAVLDARGGGSSPVGGAEAAAHAGGAGRAAASVERALRGTDR